MGTSLTTEQKNELVQLNQEIAKIVAEAKEHKTNCSELLSYTSKTVVGVGSISYHEIVPGKKTEQICEKAEEINKRLQELYKKKQKMCKDWKVDWDYE